MPSTGKRLCFNLQQKAVLSVAVLLINMVNSLVRHRVGLRDWLCLQKAGFDNPAVWKCLVKAKSQFCSTESFPLRGIIYLESWYSISVLYVGAEISQHSTCCRGGQLLLFVPSRGDAIFASCRGNSFGRAQHVFKPNCKQTWTDEFSYVNTACHFFLFYSIVKERKIHSYHF